MRRTLSRVAAGVGALGLVMAGSTVASADDQNSANCMSGRTIGEWYDGQPPGHSTGSLVLRNMNDGSDTGRITIVEADWGKMEGWYQGGHALPNGGWNYQSQLLWCTDRNEGNYIDVRDQEDPPPAYIDSGDGGGTAYFDGGFGGGIFFVSAPIYTGTVTVRDPMPVDPDFPILPR